MNPVEVINLLNSCMTVVSKVVDSYHGVIDKYVGDMVMAFWGAPLDNPDHGRDAVLVAMAMREEQLRLTADFAAKGWPPIDIGIGLNSGPMRVGNMGSQHRLAYTVMGDAVNLGSRLEGLTKNYGVGIIIGENTRALVPDIACRLLDRVKVKGKDKAVEIFEPIAPLASLDGSVRLELENWQILIAAYFAQNWHEVDDRLGKARTLGTPPFLIDLFTERVADLKSTPLPADWDGVTAFKSK